MQRRPLRPHTQEGPEEGDTKGKEYYQFGGAVGALLTSISLLGLTYIVVEKIQCGKWQMLRLPELPRHIGGWLDVEASVMWLGWLGVQCVLYLLPIGGPTELGPPTKDNGRRLTYRLNGFFVFVVNMVAVMTATYAGVPVTMLTYKMLQMLTTGLVTFFFLSIILYIKAMSLHPKDRSPLGQTESSYYNWFIGRELHPRFGFLDIKFVFFRSGIIGWMIFNWVNVVDAYENGRLTLSLMLVCGLQFVYVADTFWFENGMLVSRDMVHEAVGFNILSLFLMIPFTYCVQTRYLSTTGFTLHWYSLLAIIGINLTGYWILRGSNSEKTNFRKNPKDPAFANYKTLPTKVKGKNLLVSGWWGLSRHPNYFGDIIISFSFALPTGYGHFMPYLNPLFLVMLLVDRERMDGAECAERYGEVWDKYCEKVPYRIIPYVY